MKSEISKQDILENRVIFDVTNGPDEYYRFQVTLKHSKKFGIKRFFAVLKGTGTRQKHTYMGVLSPSSGAIKITPSSKMHDQSRVIIVARRAMTYIWHDMELPDGFIIERPKS